MAYKKFLIQKLKATPSLGIDSDVHSSDEWGMYVKGLPFRPFPDAKDVPANDWKDQHGDDEFVPDDLPMKAYEMEVGFAYKGLEDEAASKIRKFMEYLAYGGMFSVYSEYSRVGRTNVRYVSYEDDAESFMDDGQGFVTFKVKLKVNDPVTDIKLTL